VVAVGACSFRTHAAGDDGAGAAVDASHGTIDAARDAAAVSPDACADSDSDGICDAVDDWPCGAKPTSSGASVAIAHGGATNASVTSISISGGQLIVVAPGAALPVQFHYAITDTACGGNCIDQLELGYVPGDRVECVFDQAVSKSSGATGNTSTSVNAPATAGSYDLRIGIGQNYSCTYGGASTWYYGQPDSTQTLAKLCVH